MVVKAKKNNAIATKYEPTPGKTVSIALCVYPAPGVTLAKPLYKNSEAPSLFPKFGF